MENWGEIKGFEGFSVSDLGRVRNDDTERILTILRNQHGTCYVGLNKGGRQHRRSVAQLVGETFVPRYFGRRDFNRLIHKDIDRTNNRADNLVWRPHWFMVKYLIQAKTGQVGSNKPVIEKKNHEIFPNSWEASLAYGLLEKDLISSILNHTVTWPTYQEFHYHE